MHKCMFRVALLSSPRYYTFVCENWECNKGFRLMKKFFWNGTNHYQD